MGQPTHKIYPVMVPGHGWPSNITLAGEAGVYPESYECDSFPDTESGE